MNFFDNLKSYLNELDTICEWKGRDLCGTRIQVHAQLRIPLKSLITSEGKLDMSCKRGQAIWLTIRPQVAFLHSDYNYSKENDLTGTLSAIYHLVQPGWIQLLWWSIINFFGKRCGLNRRWTVPILSLSLIFPGGQCYITFFVRDLPIYSECLLE